MTPAAAPLYVTPEFEARAAAFRDAVGAAVLASPLGNPHAQPAPEVAFHLACPSEIAREALGVLLFQGIETYIQTPAGLAHPRIVEAMQRAIVQALAGYARQVEADAAAAARRADAAARAEALDKVRHKLRTHLHLAAIEQAVTR